MLSPTIYIDRAALSKYAVRLQGERLELLKQA
jgi:hypothetical protein